MKLIINPMMVVWIGIFLYACGPSEKTLDLVKRAKTMYGTLPKEMPGSENDTPELIALGKKLYFDASLSDNNTKSCNTCHNILEGKGGTDNLETSIGSAGKNEERNTPTVLNAGFQAALFWDGRARDLSDLAKKHLLNPTEMGNTNEMLIEEKLSAIEDYKNLFLKAYPKDSTITLDKIGNALAAFQRTLRTQDRFDDFISGNYKAFSDKEVRGLEVFMTTGCATCHNGPLFGGRMFMKLGVVNPYENKEDTGKFKITNQEGDMYVFKVPSLRNVALTAPYYHDGKVKTLEEAVKKMAYLQLGKDLAQEEVDSLVSFLGTLTDIERLKK